VTSAFRALQNPGLFKYEHYRQAALAVCAGILIRFLIAVPVSIYLHSLLFFIKKNAFEPFAYQSSGEKIIAIKASLWGASIFINFESATWDRNLAGGLDFIANSVLQIPFFLMNLMRYLTPTLDQMYVKKEAPPQFSWCGMKNAYFNPFFRGKNQVHGFPQMGRSDIYRKT
jgi:hypothetical protein